MAVEDVVLAFCGGVNDFVWNRDLEQRRRLIATTDAGDGGSEFARPRVVVRAAHDESSSGENHCSLTMLMGRSLPICPAGKVVITRVPRARKPRMICSPIFRTDRVGRGQKGLIDAHGGSAGGA